MADLAVASSARIDRFPAKAGAAVLLCFIVLLLALSVISGAAMSQGGEKMRRSLGSKPKPSPPAPATNKVKSLVYQAPPPPPSA